MFQLKQVLIVDNSEYFSQSTWELLLPDTEFQIVGLVNHNDEVVKMITSDKPDVILVDLCRARAEKLQTVQAIRTAQPELPIIALISSSLPEYQQKATEAGATICLEKSDMATSLAPTINNITPDRPLLPKSIFANWKFFVERKVNTAKIDSIAVARNLLYAAMGLTGGVIGATLAIWIVAVVQSFMPSAVTLSIEGTLPLIGLTIIMSFFVSSWLRKLTYIAFPHLSRMLNGQAVNMILVSSISTGTLEVLLFTRGGGLY